MYKKLLILILAVSMLVACGSGKEEDAVTYEGENGVYHVSFTKYGNVEDARAAIPEDVTVDLEDDTEDLVYLVGELVLSYSEDWTGAAIVNTPTTYRFVTTIGHEATVEVLPEEEISDDTLRVHIPLITTDRDDGNGNDYVKFIFAVEGRETVIHLKEVEEE